MQPMANDGLIWGRNSQPLSQGPLSGEIYAPEPLVDQVNQCLPLLKATSFWGFLSLPPLFYSLTYRFLLRALPQYVWSTQVPASGSASRERTL